MPYVLMPNSPGQPIIALRTDEKHYDHVQQGERTSLVIYPLVPRSKSPKELPLPKLNITAVLKSIVEPELISDILGKYGTQPSIVFNDRVLLHTGRSWKTHFFGFLLLLILIVKHISIQI